MSECVSSKNVSRARMIAWGGSWAVCVATALVLRIAVPMASTSTNQQGQEAAIFKAVLKHSIILAVLVGLVVMLYAYVLTGLIPK